MLHQVPNEVPSLPLVRSGASKHSCLEAPCQQRKVRYVPLGTRLLGLKPSVPMLEQLKHGNIGSVGSQLTW